MLEQALFCIAAGRHGVLVS